MVKSCVPERGEAVWIDMDPQAGHEQKGRRPALVLSPASYNGRVGLAILCPITSQIKGYPFEVIISGEHRISGAVLSDEVQSMDWRAGNSTFICDLPKFVTTEVLARLQTLLAV